MRKLLLLLLVLLSALSVRAQVSYTYATGQYHSAFSPGAWEVRNATVPSTATLTTGTVTANGVVSSDVYVETLVCSTGSTADAITLRDTQATPTYFLRAVPIAANTTYTVFFTPNIGNGGVRAVNGLTWLSSAGSVQCTITGRY